MKNIKLRIVYLILCSALLLFALFMLAVNLIIPAHFVREAKKALINEAQYQNRTIPYTDDGSFFDDEWNDTEEHFLTPSIVFLELDNANQSSGWNRDAYRLEKKLLEYCKGRDLSLNQCYTFKTDKHHLIFMSVQEEQDDWEKPYAYIMYIDIGPITRYIVTLNWAFFAAGTDLVGGLMSMRIIHYFMMYIFICFMLIHIYLANIEGISPTLLMFFWKEHGGLVYDPEKHTIVGEDDLKHGEKA